MPSLKSKHQLNLWAPCLRVVHKNVISVHGFPARFCIILVQTAGQTDINHSGPQCSAATRQGVWVMGLSVAFSQLPKLTLYLPACCSYFALSPFKCAKHAWLLILLALKLEKSFSHCRKSILGVEVYKAGWGSSGFPHYYNPKLFSQCVGHHKSMIK